jgi:hypothetical protein
MVPAILGALLSAVNAYGCSASDAGDGKPYFFGSGAAYTLNVPALPTCRRFPATTVLGMSRKRRFTVPLPHKAAEEYAHTLASIKLIDPTT